MAVSDNQLDLSGIPLVDNHAHSINRDFLSFAKVEFRSCFTESIDSEVFNVDMPHCLSYRHLLKTLGLEFGSLDEDELLALRTKSDPRDYVGKLFSNVLYQTALIDDGYGESTNISLNKFESLFGAKVYRIMRIETELEKLFCESKSVDELFEKFKTVLRGSKNVAGLKTIAAYRGGLELSDPDRESAQVSFLKKVESVSHGKVRLSGEAYHHYLLRKVFGLAKELDLPVQVHCGFGDRDLDLEKSNPICLTNVIKEEKFSDTKFVLLHCYPFIKEASYLASLFKNVFIDLSLAPIMVSSRIKEIYLDCLALAPVNKILAGTDGHTVPEMHWYGATMTYKGIGDALSHLINESFIDSDLAIHYAKKVLGQNAKDLYRID